MPTIQQRFATKDQWATRNPVLAPGEVGLEIGPDLTINKLKVGNGFVAWADLPYFSTEEGHGLDAEALVAELSNPETATNSAVLSIVNSAIPTAALDGIDYSDDIATPRPAWAGSLVWKTTHPTAVPVHIANDDVVRRLSETVIPWTPAMLPNVHLWLDALTLNATADSPVEQWSDLSGQGRHAKQSTVANQPLYRASGLNGHPCLEFDGISDIMFTDAFTPSVAEAWTDYVVMQSTVETTSGSDFILGGLSDDGGSQRLDMYRTTANALAISRGSALTGPPLDNGVHRLRGVYNGATSLAQVDNGTPVTGTTPKSNINVAKHVIGGRGDLANFFVGKISEVIRIRGLVSPEDHVKVVAYLQARWGVA